MTYEQLKYLKPSDFKRRCGVYRETFQQMIEVLHPHLNRQGKRGGQCKLSVEDQLLLVLEKGARISHSISHRHELGTQRVGSMSADPESRRIVNGLRQVLSTGQKAALPECLHLERLCGGCNRKPD